MPETHWIIVEKPDATGAVLWPDFPTDGAHPKDRGLPGWDSDTMAAHQTDRAPDPALDEIDRATWTWRPSIAVLKQRARTRINAEREARKDAGCDTPAGFVDTDPASRANITGAATAAMIAQAGGAPFAITWTLFDNSTVDLDGADMIALSMAVLAHITAVHDTATALKAAIDAAATAEGIDAVQWPA